MNLSLESQISALAARLLLQIFTRFRPTLIGSNSAVKVVLPSGVWTKENAAQNAHVFFFLKFGTFKMHLACCFLYRIILKVYANISTDKR